MVMMLRVRDGRSPFSPDRNHIHHKLLTLGLKHHQAVALIYGVQALIILSAWLLRYENDALVLAVYGLICASCVVSYRMARWWRRGRAPAAATMPAAHPPAHWKWPEWSNHVRWAAVRYVEWSVAGYLIVGAAIARSVPSDISVLALGLAGAAALVVLLLPRFSTPAIRISAYLAAIYVTYLGATSPQLPWLNAIEFNLWLTSVAGALAAIVILSPRDQFQVSTLDLLIVLVLIAALTIPTPLIDHAVLTRILLRSLVMLYACELLLSLRKARLGPVGMAAILALIALGGRLILGYWNLNE
jgi:UDP-GlcNAc:undecaprenyl-phosphate GlcNAc-1-phosphate transferase